AVRVRREALGSARLGRTSLWRSAKVQEESCKQEVAGGGQASEDRDNDVVSDHVGRRRRHKEGARQHSQPDPRRLREHPILAHGASAV
ncbi:MAG TPA: hypothetical protein VF714_09295, partial [Jatrophihabitans sp.]